MEEEEDAACGTLSLLANVYLLPEHFLCKPGFITSNALDLY